jgi:cobalamin biosynthesis Mg chelatase CobN
MTTDDRAKTGARKTALPGPEVAAASADDPAATQSGYGAAAAAAVREQEKAKEKEQPKRTSTPMPATAAKAVPAPAAAAASEKVRTPRRETPIWTYVGVGVLFGAVLIGIYQLVGWLSH